MSLKRSTSRSSHPRMKMVVGGKRFKIPKDLVVFFQRKLADETVKDYFKNIKAKDFRRYLQAVEKATYPTMAKPRRVMRLAIVARGLKSSDLYDTLVQRVLQTVELENCLKLARLAHFMGVPEVEHAAVDFALTHREEVWAKALAGKIKLKPRKITHCWRCRCKYNQWKSSESSTPCELEFILESGIGVLDDLWDGQYSTSGLRLGKGAVIGAGDCPEWSSGMPSGAQAKSGRDLRRRDLFLNTVLRARTFPMTVVPKRRVLSHGIHLPYGVL
ncbi:uncharacterized protein LOC144925871 [Branchiostoma floridae x Branchiostoma belcheri]